MILSFLVQFHFSFIYSSLVANIWWEGNCIALVTWRAVYCRDWECLFLASQWSWCAPAWAWRLSRSWCATPTLCCTPPPWSQSILSSDWSILFNHDIPRLQVLQINLERLHESLLQVWDLGGEGGVRSGLEQCHRDSEPCHVHGKLATSLECIKESHHSSLPHYGRTDSVLENQTHREHGDQSGLSYLLKYPDIVTVVIISEVDDSLIITVPSDPVQSCSSRNNIFIWVCFLERK